MFPTDGGDTGRPRWAVVPSVISGTAGLMICWMFVIASQSSAARVILQDLRRRSTTHPEFFPRLHGSPSSRPSDRSAVGPGHARGFSWSCRASGIDKRIEKDRRMVDSREGLPVPVAMPIQTDWLKSVLIDRGYLARIKGE